MATFNPYKEAAGDAAMQRNSTRRWWRSWCCKCNTEKPTKGGKNLDTARKPGSSKFASRNGTVQRFICTECLAKRETAN